MTLALLKLLTVKANMMLFTVSVNPLLFSNRCSPKKLKR